MSALTLHAVAENDDYIVTAEYSSNSSERGYYVSVMDANTFDDIASERATSYEKMMDTFNAICKRYNLTRGM